MPKAIGAVLLSLGLLTAGDAAAQRRSEMQINRKPEMQPTSGPAQNFTGTVTITGQVKRDQPTRITGAIVEFKRGSRTAWHSHPLGQTLIVTEGVGWTQVKGKPIVEFQAGDLLFCPADKKHRHGATSTQGLTHVAAQEALDGQNVT